MSSEDTKVKKHSAKVHPALCTKNYTMTIFVTSKIKHLIKLYYIK
jgi:hypothetical protein